jgi:hypothetical protein
LTYAANNEAAQTKTVGGDLGKFDLETSFSEFDSLTFSLKAKGESCETSAVNAEILNEFALPGPPKLSFVKKIDCNKVELAISPPGNTGGLPITEYILYRAVKG